MKKKTKRKKTIKKRKLSKIQSLELKINKLEAFINSGLLGIKSQIVEKCTAISNLGDSSIYAISPDTDIVDAPSIGWKIDKYGHFWLERPATIKIISKENNEIRYLTEE